MEELKATPSNSKLKPNFEQLKFMEMTAKARVRCSELARDASFLSLMTLAREWDYLGKALETAIQRQLNVFDDVPTEVSEWME